MGIDSADVFCEQLLAANGVMLLMDSSGRFGSLAPSRLPSYVLPGTRKER